MNGEIQNFAKPFLKWAGGKTQLIPQISEAFPKDLENIEFTYIEPFVGSGAVLFWILNKYPQIKRAVINDINEDLINTYRVISQSPNELITLLEAYQAESHAIDSNDDLKKEYYYSKRALFNTRSTLKEVQAALFIFLNKTCFNGLYRVNSSNLFNVPIGKYKKPTICDKSNILAVSDALKKVEILSGDYENTLNYTDSFTLFYFDPPYKPLDKTSSFNSYAKDSFDDNEQIRLKEFCAKLNSLKYKWMLSNSDIKGKNIEDNFFDNLYEDFTIQRVNAKRSINANPLKRGQLTELLINNY